MKLKILPRPVEVNVSLMPGCYIPDCINPEYRPFEQLEFDAIAKAVWCDEDNDITYVSIQKDGNPYVVLYRNLAPLSMMTIKKEAEPLPVETSLDVINEKYTMRALATDLCLKLGQFDVNVTSVDGVEFEADLKWQLHGHVKQVNGLRRLIAMDEKTGNISVL